MAGGRRCRGLLVTVLLAMAVVYGALYGLTASLGHVAS
jgi:hypothetical protein